MNKKVFISHSHEDGDDADSIAAVLAASPSVPCFAFHRDQKIGTDFRKRILRELDQAVAVIVICSATSRMSPEVLFELGYATGKGIAIFPLFNGKTPMQFPYLDNIHGYSLDQGNKRDTLELLKIHLRELINKKNQTSLVEKNQGSSIAHKIEKAGLVDISVGWKGIDWPPRDIESLLERLAPNSDLYMVGRTFMAWARNAKGFAKQIAMKSIRCQMVIANPEIPDLKSLVRDDQAQGELVTVYQTFVRELPIGFREALQEGSTGGFIEIYGIPAYVPETFSHIKLDNGIEYCNLEVGIAVDPSERVPIFFKHVSKNDVYSSLRKIYENIVTHDPNQEVAKLLFRVDPSNITNDLPSKIDDNPLVHRTQTKTHVERTEQMHHSKQVIRYFVSYAHDDNALKEKLMKPLRQRLAIAKDYHFEAWDDKGILAGEHWHERIKEAISHCQFGLLLVSPAFLGSAYIEENELPTLIPNNNLLSPEPEKRAIPVALKRIPFDNSIDLKGLERVQVFHDKAGKAFQERSSKSNTSEDFAAELFQQIINIVKRYGSDEEQNTGKGPSNRGI